MCSTHSCNACGNQKKALDAQWLLVAMWVLGTNPKFCIQVPRALICQAIYLTLSHLLKNKKKCNPNTTKCPFSLNQCNVFRYAFTKCIVLGNNVDEYSCVEPSLCSISETRPWNPSFLFLAILCFSLDYPVSVH